MGSKALIQLCLVSTLAFPAFASAAETSDGLARNGFTQRSVDDFAKVQSDTYMIRAKNALAEEQRRLDLNQPSGGSSGASSELAFDPVVARVSGLTAEPTAYILLGNGAIVPAKVGTAIAGGYKVMAVSASQVLVEKGGKRFALGFATYRLAPRGVGAPQ